MNQLASVVIAIALTFISVVLAYIVQKINMIDDIKTDVAVMKPKVESLHEWRERLQEDALTDYLRSKQAGA